MKPKVAIFDFASCEGCELQIANLEEDILELLGAVDVVSFREVMKETSDTYDIAIIEGSIQRPMDEERIKKIRSRAKILIAIGACACTGGVNKMRNDWSPAETLNEVYSKKDLHKNDLFNIQDTRAIDEVVPVDFYIRGCPPRKEQILYYIRRIVGVLPRKNQEVRFPVAHKETNLVNNSLVKYNVEKCILCRRCDVVCRETLGVDALTLVGKGHEIAVGTPKGTSFDTNGCIKCGQCVSACSVGALEATSDVSAIAREVSEGVRRSVMVVDSVALASYIERQPELAGMPPLAAEEYVIAALKDAGFFKVVPYEHYMAESMKRDAARGDGKKSALLSWCKGSFNYLQDKDLEDKVDICEDGAPWKIVLDEFSGKDMNVCLLSPCTALKGVSGFSHVFSAMELDAFFKILGVEPTFSDPFKGKYDVNMVREVHPGIGPMRMPGDLKNVQAMQIERGAAEKIAALKGKGAFVDLNPCMRRCLNGGGCYPTVDENVVEARRKWLFDLWDASQLSKSDREMLDAIVAGVSDPRKEKIRILLETQRKFEYLREDHMKYLASKMDSSFSEVYGIATFYSYFNLAPSGRHTIVVCEGTSCHVKGSNSLRKKLKDILGIDIRETTRDRRFSMKSVRCLGCCGIAPVITVDGDTYGRVKASKLQEILSKYA